MRREYAREHADEMRAGAANAMEAARKSPLSGGYESNVCAKNWVLCDPSGNEHHVTNLKLYVREYPEAFPNPASAYSMFGPAVWVPAGMAGRWSRKHAAGDGMSLMRRRCRRKHAGTSRSGRRRKGSAWSISHKKMG